MVFAYYVNSSNQSLPFLIARSALMVLGKWGIKLGFPAFYNLSWIPKKNLTTRSIDKYLSVENGEPNLNKLYKNSETSEESLCSLRKYTSAKNIYTNDYNDTSKRFQGFFELMLRWKGSVFKLIGHNLLLFIVVYVSISLTYRFVLSQNPQAKEYFEILCIYCSR